MMLFGKEYIMDRDGSNLYLERWQILKSKLLSVYVHRVHRGDDPVFRAKSAICGLIVAIYVFLID